MQELIKIYNLIKDTNHYLPKYRLLIILDYFLGFPYSSEDSLETYALTHFDCVTFVETVLALLFVRDLDSFDSFKKNFEHELMSIRYFDSSHDFKSRNHFVSLDWLPHSKDYLNDITRDICQAKISSTIIDKDSWFYKVHNLKKTLLAPVTVKLPYIDNSELLSNYDDLIKYFPSISIVNIVRPDWAIKSKIGTNLDISHLGFVVKHAGKLTFWHASSIPNMVICDQLNSYIMRQQHIPSIKGINVQSIQGVYK